MTTTTQPHLPSSLLQILTCAQCKELVLPWLDPTIGPVYDCQPVCRPLPLDARELEHQLHRALAGIVAMDRAAQVLERIVITDASPSGLHLIWKVNLPPRPQPPATPPPSEGFVPPRPRSRP
ncbi:hypothetical protein [Hamadaea tsunoensis]|uniref:hypothetical protein n=1 Tax=Hamadaea tsunoensis TaxID=53368 RepID=UPI000406FC0D|nr:hypothetical protein [Hamadaea tsunoensis]